MNDTTALEFIKISGPLDYPFEERSNTHTQTTQPHTHSFIHSAVTRFGHILFDIIAFVACFFFLQ